MGLWISRRWICSWGAPDEHLSQITLKPFQGFEASSLKIWAHAKKNRAHA